MNHNKIKNYFVMFVIIFSAFSMGQSSVFAVSSPSLGAAGNYGILASTFTNAATGVSVTGDVGYITQPAIAATVNGTIFVNNGTYSQAGTDQGSALSTLNALSCTQSFIAATDLAATNSTNQTLGHYTPGVYCISAAQSIGTAGITLDGSGTYVFRSTGALNTVANSHIMLINGANASDIFWTPVVTTLGANTNFTGTVIDPAGITMGTDVTWLGRALAFGNTVTADANDKITVPGFVAPIPQISVGLGTASNYVILSGSVITNGVPNLLVTGNTGHVSTLSAPFSYITGSDNVGALQVGTLTTIGTPLGDEHTALGNI